MRVVAILAAHNEQRFIGHCLEQFHHHGVDTYLIDNDSTDATAEIAERHLGRGLIEIERVPRHGIYSWKPILARKAAIAAELDTDWLIHADPDEVRLPPAGDDTLAAALARADEDGFNAVNFQEFTFLPTVEEPDHDHPGFPETMRRYYPFLPSFPHRLNAWKQTGGPVDLAQSGGHRVEFAGLRMHPQSFPMRHYLFLSREHGVEKYAARTYDPAEVASGLHRARAAMLPEDIRLPRSAELRPYRGDALLDASEPLTSHPCFP